MPTIATPRSFGNHLPQHDDRRRADAPASGISLRVKVATRRAALTRQLADGADPSSTPELALRATQLTSARRRRQMARTLRQTITEARQPSLMRAVVSIIDRHAVREAEDAMQMTIARLASPEPVTPKGMAMLEHMLTDGITSPLYNRSEPGSLRRQVLVAKAELDPAGLEAPIAA